jgi:hypothetical protein
MESWHHVIPSTKLTVVICNLAYLQKNMYMEDAFCSIMNVTYVMKVLFVVLTKVLFKLITPAYIMCVCVIEHYIHTYITFNYMHPYWMLLHPLGSWSGYGPIQQTEKRVIATQQKAIRIMVCTKQRECYIELFKRFYILPHTSEYVVLLSSFVVYSMVEIQE